MNATPTKKERIYVHLNKSTQPWTCEIRSELDDSILAGGLSADGYQDHTSSADQIVRAVNSFDAMKEALELIVAWNRSGGASSLEEARELTYRKAQAALALAKGSRER